MVCKPLGHDCVLEGRFAVSVWRPFDGTRCQDQLFSGDISKRQVNEDDFTHSGCLNSGIASLEAMTSFKTSNIISTVFCLFVSTCLETFTPCPDRDSVRYTINTLISRKWKEQG